MSSDSRESLDYREPFPIYESRYQDCDPKSLDSSPNIKTQDLRVLIQVSMSSLKRQKSQFQSPFQDFDLKFFLSTEVSDKTSGT